MDILNLALTTPSILVSLNYSEGVGEIIIAVDASLKGQEKVLIELVQGEKYPLRYESEIWSSVEKKYDATK